MITLHHFHLEGGLSWNPSQFLVSENTNLPLSNTFKWNTCTIRKKCISSDNMIELD
jgi:hypothetical protein